MSRLASPTVTHVGLEHAWLSWPAPPNATSAFAEYAVHAIDVATNAPLLSVGGAVGRQFARVDGLQPGRSYRFSVQQSAGGRVVGEPSALSPPATTAAAADVLLLVGGPAPAADDSVVVLRHLQSSGWWCASRRRRRRRGGCWSARGCSSSRARATARRSPVGPLDRCGRRRWRSAGRLGGARPRDGERCARGRGRASRPTDRSAPRSAPDASRSTATRRRSTTPPPPPAPPSSSTPTAARRPALPSRREAARRGRRRWGSTGAARGRAPARALLTAAVRWTMGDGTGGGGWGGGGWGAAPEVHELFARQGRGRRRC